MIYICGINFVIIVLRHSIKTVYMEKINNLYWNMRQDFYKKYREKIIPAVQTYEKSRKIRLFWASIISSIFIAAGLFFVYAQFFIAKDSDCIKGAILFFGLFCAVWYGIKKNFENKVKKDVMPIVCSCFEDLKWSQEGYYYGEFFSESGVIPTFHNESYDDIFTGSYKDVAIEIVESEYERGSGKSRHTVFGGVIIKLSMNKSFKSHTVVKPDSMLHISPKSGLKRTEFEDPEFNKKFDVFTNDAVDARYLITTSFMERLKNIKTAFKAKDISCAFYKECFMLALSTNKDLFSICSLVKKIDDAEQYLQMYSEIESIIALIDHFKLDQNIGL